MSKINITIFCLLTLVLLTSCGRAIRDGEPAAAIDVKNIKNAVPKPEPLSKSGNSPSYVVSGRRYYTLKSSRGFVQQGIASWYGTRFHGNKTANGETYDMYKMTAAHKTLPLPSYVAVKNLDNGREITVRVNDRGPFVDGRIIDLSYAAAIKLGIRGSGTARVEIRDARFDNDELDLLKDHQPSYFLQLGAFSNRANADKLQSQVSGLIENDVIISQVKMQDQILHRVRIGPFAARTSANHVSDQLIRRGVISQALLIVQ